MRRTSITIKSKSIIIILAIIIVASVVSAPISFGVAGAIDLNGVNSSTLWQYQANFLNVAEAKSIVNTWDLSGISEPIVIGIIDTGIQASHSVFNGVLTTDENENVKGYNALGGSDIRDNSIDNYHGTNVAGVIALLIKELGLENYIKIYPIKANTKDTKTFTTSALVSALEHAKVEGVDVINMSLGYTESVYKTLKLGERNAFEFALENARNDAIIVASAGNADSPQENTKFYPAALASTISVMGYGKNSRVFNTSNFGSIYDICAPGEDIVTLSNQSGYVRAKGTSMASASVSFAAALLKLRYLAQGQELSVVQLERYIRSLEGISISKNDVSYSGLTLTSILSQDFDTNVNDYVNPKELSIVHNGALGSDDYAHTIYMLANNKIPTTFYAQLSPASMVDPDIANMVEWSIALVERDSEIIISEQKLDAKGTRLDFLPTRGGDFLLIARLQLFNLEAEVPIHVEYLPYLVGEVRVTYADQAHLGVDKAPTGGVLYTNESTRFALTGIEYLNPDEEIKWYVNGEYVTSAREFEFCPQKAGTYFISAQYGNEGKVDFDYQFTAEVKSFILRPLDLSMLCVGIVVVIIMLIVVLVLYNRKKKLKN